MNYLAMFQHLLPTGRAWRITIDKKLRQIFSGFSIIPEDVKRFADSNIWDEIFPQTTTKLNEWEDQFGLLPNVVDEQSRRDRLAATWKALIGGQDSRHIQDTLQNAGFDVYVHDWWESSTPPTPGSPGSPVARNPLLWLAPDTGSPTYGVLCGGPQSYCGEEFAQCGNSHTPIGYALVNKIHDRVYTIPTDPALWPYFVYIGGETFGDTAQVLSSRREEFEAACLKVCPLHLWIGLLVEYN